MQVGDVIRTLRARLSCLGGLFLGIGSVVDVGLSSGMATAREVLSRNPTEADTAALAADWGAVGADFWRSLETVRPAQ